MQAVVCSMVLPALNGPHECSKACHCCGTCICALHNASTVLQVLQSADQSLRSLQHSAFCMPVPALAAVPAPGVQPSDVSTPALIVHLEFVDDLGPGPAQATQSLYLCRTWRCPFESAALVLVHTQAHKEGWGDVSRSQYPAAGSTAYIAALTVMHPYGIQLSVMAAMWCVACCCDAR
jgi:hypothetical protein